MVWWPQQELEQTRNHWRMALVTILLVALAIRLGGVFHDLPFSYFGDELHLVKRAMAMGTGDLNPHWFHKPALLMYLLLLCYGLFFVIGRGIGAFDSAEMFGAYFLANAGPFLLIGRLLIVVLALAGLWATFALARRAFGMAAGLAAVATAALLVPMVIAAQVIKEDLPAGAFLALAVHAYLGTRADDRLRPLVLAALCAGLSMAFKYYGVAALPVFMLAELARHWSRGAVWGVVAGRYLLLGVVCAAAFVAASPYHVLDPTWSQSLYHEHLQPFFDGGSRIKVDPDTDIAYRPGLAAMPGALLHFLGVLASAKAFGPVFGPLAAVGLWHTLRSSETRWNALVIFGPVVVFALLAAALAPYHSAHRHLNAIYPLLCAFVLPGIQALGGVIALPAWRHRIVTVVTAAVIAAAVPTVIGRQITINRLDSRTVAYAWMKDNLPPGARILADGAGPTLTPDAAAVRRWQAQLATVPGDSPFIRAQRPRLDLLGRYPAAESFNFDELADPWWLSEEVPPEHLTTDAYHLDMGNPLVIRIPRPLAAYQAEGVRYLVLTSQTQRLYDGTERGTKFPSYRRFLEDVAALHPVRRFDPADWQGKGPIVWIYDLTQRRADREPQP